SDALHAIINTVVHALIADKRIHADQLGITLIDLRDPQHLATADYHGEERFYPASVVKLFYLAAIERQLEDKQVTDTPELERGIHDMIVSSSNEATQYILDVITDTSSGAELPQKEFEAWQYKRNRVNRWFSEMGYANINVDQKTFCEDAYGIEQQSRGYKGNNRNALTTNATARLLSEIVLGRMNTPERTAGMMILLSRDWSKPSTDVDDQPTGFTGRMLIERKLSGTRLWSKAGWTSTERHDAAYIETPDGLKFVLVVFTHGHANDRDILPVIAGKILDALRNK
ncbi:MAG TPA: serine hydrolase, partial [Pyrinomonadaceae bacterium]